MFRNVTEICFSIIVVIKVKMIYQTNPSMFAYLNILFPACSDSEGKRYVINVAADDYRMSDYLQLVLSIGEEFVLQVQYL